MLKNKTGHDKRDVSFDFLKVAATILIVCHHFQQALEVRWGWPMINFFGGRFYFGYLVELFFIISGMCASGWIPAIGEVITFPAYLYRRAKRLLPLNALSVIVFSVLKLVYYFIHHEWLYNIPFDLWGMVSACLGIQAGWATSNPMLNNPVWYISVLMWCYIVLYFVTWLGKNLWGGKCILLLCSGHLCGHGDCDIRNRAPVSEQLHGTRIHVIFPGNCDKGNMEACEYKKNRDPAAFLAAACRCNDIGGIRIC